MARKFIQNHSVVAVGCNASEMEAVEIAVSMANCFVNDNYTTDPAYIAKAQIDFMFPVRADIIGNFMIALDLIDKKPRRFLLALSNAVKDQGIVLEDCAKVGGFK